MSDISTPQEMLESSCSTNSEPFALQNLGGYMEPEFSENCILIIDPGMKLHLSAYAVIRYDGDMYFRQYIERGAKKFLVPLNTQHDEIELKNEFEVVGCVVQQKQRKQQALHYYHLNTITKEMDFSISGKPKDKEEK
ncbi:MAG: phage repressor protein [Gammaproteobacteria bacterium]|uniref:Prophage repressor protein n=1 Tax=endosymbiont of Bathymodiolus septemdierum str. Myojin knoll TaxID=1303921 RepID=A0A0P0UR07_9GAMM|nr:S24 family peptidase [Bathymodiolus septemdierum thioautotrophic gill symbiont]RUA06543.1 MAG: phage repressor protein [Gammaproteobacteria bacterium]BAS67644.1 prophage repressor protein [endosymbiont of Bathymodiolus septemdierum str. Myojin knoll]